MHSLIQIDLARALAAEKPKAISEWQALREMRRVRRLRLRLWPSIAPGVTWPSYERRRRAVADVDLSA